MPKTSLGRDEFLFVKQETSFGEIAYPTSTGFIPHLTSKLKLDEARESRQEQSGVSKAFDFLDTYQALSDKAFQIEEGMKKVLQTFALVETKEKSVDVSVKMTRNFGVEKMGDMIEDAKKLFGLGIPDSFKRELLSELAYSKLGWSLKDVRKKVMKDIEKMDLEKTSLQR